MKKFKFISLLIFSTPLVGDFSKITKRPLFIGLPKANIPTALAQSRQEAELRELNRVLNAAQIPSIVNFNQLIEGINFSKYPKMPTLGQSIGVLVPGIGLPIGLLSADKLLQGAHATKVNDAFNAVKEEEKIWWNSLTPAQRNDRDFRAQGFYFAFRSLAARDHADRIGVTAEEKIKFNIAHGGIFMTSMFMTGFWIKFAHYIWKNK